MKIAIFTNSKNKTGLSELVPLSIFFKEQGHEPFFIFELDNDANIDVINNLYSKGIVSYSNGNKADNDQQLTPGKSQTKYQQSFSAWIYLKKIFKKKPFFSIAIAVKGAHYFLQHRAKIKQQLSKAGIIFSKEKFDILVASDDRGTSGILALNNLCKKNNVPFITLQIAADDQFFLYKSYRKNEQFNSDTLLNKILLNKTPNQHHSFENKKITFYPWHVALALKTMGMLPTNPWYNGQSFSDKNLVLSNEYFEKYSTVTNKQSHNIVVGQFSHDKLYQSYIDRKKIKKKLLTKYFNSAESKKDVIIYSAPQFFEHRIFSEIRSKEEIEYILDVLNNFTDKLTLVSLHPKMKYNNYKYINKKYENIKVLDTERLSETLPVCEYFISTFESTISWALMCKIVPIFLDYYNLGFDLTKFPATQILSEKEKFKANIKNIFKCKERILTTIDEASNLLPPFDGNSGERILNEIKSMAN